MPMCIRFNKHTCVTCNISSVCKFAKQGVLFSGFSTVHNAIQSTWSALAIICKVVFIVNGITGVYLVQVNAYLFSMLLQICSLSQITQIMTNIVGKLRAHNMFPYRNITPSWQCYISQNISRYLCLCHEKG